MKRKIHLIISFCLIIAQNLFSQNSLTAHYFQHNEYSFINFNYLKNVNPKNQLLAGVGFNLNPIVYDQSSVIVKYHPYPSKSYQLLDFNVGYRFKFFSINENSIYLNVQQSYSYTSYKYSGLNELNQFKVILSSPEFRLYNYFSVGYSMQLTQKLALDGSYGLVYQRYNKSNILRTGIQLGLSINLDKSVK